MGDVKSMLSDSMLSTLSGKMLKGYMLPLLHFICPSFGPLGSYKTANSSLNEGSVKFTMYMIFDFVPANADVNNFVH